MHGDLIMEIYFDNSLICTPAKDLMQVHCFDPGYTIDAKGIASANKAAKIARAKIAREAKERGWRKYPYKSTPEALAAGRLRNNARYRKLIEQGKCIRCAGDRDDPNKVRCASCREILSTRRKEMLYGNS